MEHNVTNSHKSFPELINFLQAALDSETPIDVLPICRQNIESFQTRMDEAIEWDLQPLVFTTGFQGLVAIGITYDDEGQPEISEAESDFVTFSLTKYSTGYRRMPSVYSLTRYLAIILLSDCTGCCNALDFIKVSSSGLLAQGNVSSTYHS